MFMAGMQGKGGNDHESCEPDLETDEDYRLTFRIVSLFVLLIVSLLGATIAVLSARVKQCRIPDVVISTGKFFGTG
jgi:hypothetical protein